MVFEQKMMYLPEKPNMERWAGMPFIVQMANIGSEVGRTLNGGVKVTRIWPKALLSVLLIFLT